MITPANWVGTFEYRDGLIGDIHAPSSPGEWPVVVMVHGGGWYAGDRYSMTALADSLAAEGMVVFNITYQTMSLGGAFPSMVDDVACGVAEARKLASEYTTSDDGLTIVGHSAGAHLASLVALAPDEFECPDAAPEAFVGLAGPYNTDALEAILAPFYGTRLSDDPEPWKRGNTLTYVPGLEGMDVLLIHGDEDSVVPIAFSRQLAEAIDTEVNNLTFEEMPGVDHTEVRDPDIVGGLITAFIEGR